MGEIHGINFWEPSIYRIQVSDPISGGEEGITNRQPIQLANRTQYLKELFLAHHTDTGAHKINNDDVASDAALSKLDLNITTSELDTASDNVDTTIAAIQTKFNEVFNNDTLYIYNLYKRIQLDWKHSELGFAFEFWVPSLSMREYSDQTVSYARQGDDSIDVPSTDELKLRLDQTYVLYDSTHADCCTIKSKLTEGRCRTYESLTYDYTDGGKLGHTSWTISEDNTYATAKPGGLFVTSVVDTLESIPSGLFAIRRSVLTSTNDAVKVYYKTFGDTVWTPSDKFTTVTVSDEYVDEFFRITGGNIQVLVKNVSTEAIYVKWLALFPQVYPLNVTPILTPSVTSPTADREYYLNELDVSASRFASAYQDKYYGTEYKVSNLDGTVEYATKVFTDKDFMLPHAWEDLYNTIKDQVTFPCTLVIQCRHISDMKTQSIAEAITMYAYSNWSEPVNFYTNGLHIEFGYLGSVNSDGFTDYPENVLGANYLTMDYYRVHRFGFVGAANSYGFDDGTFVIPGENDE